MEIYYLVEFSTKLLLSLRPLWSRLYPRRAPRFQPRLGEFTRFPHPTNELTRICHFPRELTRFPPLTLEVTRIRSLLLETTRFLLLPRVVTGVRLCRCFARLIQSLEGPALFVVQHDELCKLLAAH